MNTILKTLCWLITLLSCQPALSCIYITDERLRVFCLTQGLSGKFVTEEYAKYIDFELQKIGFGDGLLNRTTRYKSKPSIGINPKLSYDSNINGGNVRKDIKIGNLVLTGDEKKVAKAGLVAGISATSSYRFSLDGGDFIDVSAMAEKLRSVNDPLTISNTSANLCGINHIKNWWYLDACFAVNNNRRELTSTKRHTGEFSLTRFFYQGASYQKLTFGVGLEEQNSQKGTSLRMSHVLSNKRLNNFAYSISIKNRNSENLGTITKVDLQSDAQVFNRKIKLYFELQHDDRGYFLGQKLNYTTSTIQIDVPLMNNVSGKFGYRKTDSTIDSFDSEAPIASIQMNF